MPVIVRRRLRCGCAPHAACKPASPVPHAAQSQPAPAAACTGMRMALSRMNSLRKTLSGPGLCVPRTAFAAWYAEAPTRILVHATHQISP